MCCLNILFKPQFEGKCHPNGTKNVDNVYTEHNTRRLFQNLIETAQTYGGFHFVGVGLLRFLAAGSFVDLGARLCIAGAPFGE